MLIEWHHKVQLCKENSNGIVTPQTKTRKVIEVGKQVEMLKANDIPTK